MTYKLRYVDLTSVRIEVPKKHLVSIKYAGKLYSCFYRGDVKNLTEEKLFEILGIQIPNGKTYVLG